MHKIALKKKSRRKLQRYSFYHLKYDVNSIYPMIMLPRHYGKMEFLRRYLESQEV